MDVRFCEGRNHRREAHVRAADSGRFSVRAPPKRASGEMCFPLTKTYMDVGVPGLSPALEGRDVDNAVIEAVRKWVFEPAKCDGVPMVQNILIPFEAEVR
jgi:hypothetical protein